MLIVVMTGNIMDAMDATIANVASPSILRDLGGSSSTLQLLAAPILAGVLIDANLWDIGWRLVFLINVPIGIAALAFAVPSLPAGAHRPELKLDYGGLVLAGVGLFAVIYPLIEGQPDGWPAWTFLMLAAGVVLLLGFVLYELRRHANDALIEPTLLKNRTYLSGVSVVLFFFGAFSGLLLCVSLYGQLGEGWSPIHAGLTVAPMVLGIMIGMTVSTALVERLGRHLLHIGVVTLGAGIATVALTISGMEHASSWDLLPGLLLAGAGAGTSFAQLFGFVLNSVNMDEVGSASGVLEASQQLSTSLGVAVLGTIFFSAFKHHLPTDALEVTAWASLVPLVGAFLVVFNLPRQALAEAH